MLQESGLPGPKVLPISRRSLLLIILLGALAATGVGLGLTRHRAAPVLITAESLPVPGTDFQVHLTPLRKGLDLGILVELNRVRVGVVEVRSLDGGALALEIPIPSAATTGEVQVTVAAGGRFSVARFPLR